MSLSPINLELHYKQGLVLESKATEILYGGAAGGGKSHLMRVLAVLWCASISGLMVYIFRRVFDDLVKNHVEGPSGFRAMLAQWEKDNLVQIVEDEIRFWNGSKIFLCHCKDEKHRFKYQGAEIHVLLMDELTHFTDKIYRFLRNRVRAVGLTGVPAQYIGLFPRIVCSANPGNIGHAWVKAAFIDRLDEYEVKRMPDSEGGMIRQFIPAKLTDNPSMERDDPGYRARLRGLGSEALVKAMEDGDWNVIEGAYFDCWTNRNILRPFEIPEEWTKFRSFDWGSAKPFSVGWWAIAQEDYMTVNGLIPRGALVRYREWYGMKEGKPDVGLKLTSEQVADGIIAREDEEITYSVADPAIFTRDGGPSIAEKMGDKGVWFRPADNKRVSARGAMGGWDEMRNRIIGDERPMLYVFSTCKDSIRTIPVLQHDEDRPEDLNTASEDHAADEVRYACMSRPWVKVIEEVEKPRPQDALPTLDEMMNKQSTNNQFSTEKTRRI